MALTGGVKDYRTFVQGLVTEASALTFPENASLDEDNFVLNRDGSRQRRLGMDYESGHTLVSTTKNTTLFDNYSISTYRWNNVDSDPTITLGVIQVGNDLWFVDLSAEAPSANLVNSGAPLTISGANGQKPYSFSSINGVLMVTTGEVGAFYLSYTKSSGNVSRTNIDLKIRDFFGVDDGLEVSERPSSLSDEHEYNLYNQGWSEDNINAFFSQEGVYPSNSGISSLGQTSSDTFDVDEYLRSAEYLGNTKAPKGHFIIDAFARGPARESESGVTGLPTDTDSGKPLAVCTQAGRMFYAGFESKVTDSDDKSPNYDGFIFFSQVVESNSQLGLCYQEADPTSSEISDLVDTDGGYIVIPEASNIFKLLAVGDTVVVIAETGVWQISGGEIGFAATAYQVNKITDVGAINGASVVEVEGRVFYWSTGGIYALVQDNISGRLNGQNITETTIQSFFTEISSVAQANATGAYDPVSKKIRWLYNDTDDYDGVILKHKYNRELVFDTVLGAFYPNTISEITGDSPFLAGYMPTPNYNTVEDVQQVVVDGDPVQVNGEDVVVTREVRGRGTSTTKYLTFKYDTSTDLYYFTLSHYNDVDFVDWQTEDGAGVDYSSYLITGYEIAQDISRWKQVTYASFFFNRTETGYITDDNGDTQLRNASSCKVQARWDWSDSNNSGKWGTSMQVYRLNRHYLPENAGDPFDYGYSTVVTKNKLRGKGRALSLYISSETGKDMHLLGWSLVLVGGTAV